MSKEINTGGPAFPAQFFNERATGITLRDYFAAEALPIAWAAYHEGYTGQPECVEQSIAHHAYQIADAMLAAREKGGAA